MAVDIVIHHNPECGTSRNALAMIRNAGIEPHIVEYLKTPPSRALLVELIDRAGITPRNLLREKGTPYAVKAIGLCESPQRSPGSPGCCRSTRPVSNSAERARTRPAGERLIAGLG